MTDLTAALRLIVQRLPEPLADSGARARLLQVGGQLPAELTQGPLGLEIRLAGPTVVDLFAAAVPAGAPFTALIEFLTHDGWASPQRAADLAEVLGRWQRRSGALPTVARYLLVEADAPGPGGAVPVPSIFLAPRNPHDVWRAGMKPNAFQARPDLTTMAAAELSGVWPDPATAQALARLCDALPETADVFAVGAMIGRDAGASMRVAVRRLTPEQTHDVLALVGRPRQGDVLAEYAASWAAQRQAIAFEIGPGAERRVGLELSPDLDWKQSRLEGWPELLAQVVAAGLADPERAAVVPGLVDADSDPSWGLAHVKIGADDDGLLAGSKLYVGVAHRQGPGA